MADERKIILQLEIDAQKSIQNLITVKDRIALLKVEQAALNTETVEGRKTYEAYQGQIKALTKEQSSLANAVSQTAGAMEFEKGSIAANRAELSKLTAEYKNLAKPTQEQTAKIKALSDTLKAQEGALGNTSRNVGNYKEALSGIQSQLGAFGPEVARLTQGFNGVTQGLKIASTGFRTLGGAIAATGIGLLLVLLGSLFSYFQNTDQGATKLSGVFAGFGIIVKNITGFFAEFAGRLLDVFSGTESLQSALSDLGDYILNNFMNRIKGFGVLFDAVSLAMRGKFKDASLKAADALIQINFGVTDATSKLSAYAVQIAKAAKEAYDFEIQLDLLDDAQRAMNVTNAESDAIVQKMLISAKDKTKTDQDRIKIYKESSRIEEDTVKKQLALDDRRIKLITDRNKREQDAINQKLNRDILEAKSEEKKNELRAKALDINDALDEELQGLREKRIRKNTELTLLQEKGANKIAALNEQIAADEAKRIAEYIESINKVVEADQRLQEGRIVNSNRLLEIDLQNIKSSQAAQIKALQERIKLEKLTGEELEKVQREIEERKKSAADRELEILNRQKENELLLQKLHEEDLLTNNDLLDSERTLIVENGNVERADIEQKYLEKIKGLNVEAAEEVKKTWGERFKDFFSQLNNDLKAFGGVVNQALDVASKYTQLKLENDLTALQKSREAELKKYGKTQADKDKINDKYDKKEDKRRKEAAKADATNKQISAVINTAVGVTQALAQAGPIGIITGVLVAAAGALEIAAIESQKGRLAKGGLINIGGNLHSNGGTTFRGTDGTVFEAERGEVLAVVNRHDAPKLNYLSSINSTHGNPFFGNNRPSVRRNNFADGGLVARSNGGQVLNSINQQNATVEAMRNLPDIVVTVSDINNAQGVRAQVKERANVTR